MNHLGSYHLYKQRPSQGEVLAYRDVDRISFSPGHFPKVPFVFTDIHGNIAKFLVTDKVYFLMVVCDKKGTYIYSTDQKDQFLIAQSNQLAKRIFFYVPPGTSIDPVIYTYKNNLNGCFFVHGETLDTSDIAEFNLELTDLIFIRRQKTCLSDIFVRDCTPDCTGKKCSDDNGCGLPCGCPTNKICSEGICKDKHESVPIICPETAPCGSQNGFCSGICPEGFRCFQDEGGRFSCNKIETCSFIWFIFLFILILVIFLIILWCYLNNDLF